MTQLLEQTIKRLERLSTLPEQEQDRIARDIAERLDDMQPSEPGEIQKAVAGIRALRQGNRRPEGVTVKAMIEEGRC